MFVIRFALFKLRSTCCPLRTLKTSSFLEKVLFGKGTRTVFITCDVPSRTNNESMVVSCTFNFQLNFLFTNQKLQITTRCESQEDQPTAAPTRTPPNIHTPNNQPTNQPCHHHHHQPLNEEVSEDSLLVVLSCHLD